MDEKESWLFPELERSFKQVFLLQVFAVFGLLGIVWAKFGALWAFGGLCGITLLWCAIITASLRNARANRISADVQKKMAERQQLAGIDERRLLDRAGMEPPAPPVRSDTMELTANDYGN